MCENLQQKCFIRFSPDFSPLLIQNVPQLFHQRAENGGQPFTDPLEPFYWLQQFRKRGFKDKGTML
jgi:hypothetical protein